MASPTYSPLLADAEKHFRVRYNSEQEKAFIVEKPDGTERRFIQTENGLYHLETTAASREKEEHGMKAEEPAGSGHGTCDDSSW
jgi:hypothetical protein